MTIYKIKFKVKSFKSIDISPEVLMDTLGDDFIYPNGTPIKEKWLTSGPRPNARLYNAYFDNNDGGVPDISFWLNHIVLGPDAYDALNEVLSKVAELLPIKVDNQTWYIVHVLNTTDAIDENQSQRDIEDNSFMGLARLAFVESSIENSLLFNTNYDQRQGLYCSEEFKQLVEAQGFIGPLFRNDLAANF